MAWEEVKWHVYESPDGSTRVVAPRKLWAPRGTDARKKGHFHERVLNPQEMKKGERLVATIHGVSRRTVVEMIRKNGVGKINDSVAGLTASAA